MSKFELHLNIESESVAELNRAVRNGIAYYKERGIHCDILELNKGWIKKMTDYYLIKYDFNTYFCDLKMYPNENLAGTRIILIADNPHSFNVTGLITVA